MQILYMSLLTDMKTLPEEQVKFQSIRIHEDLGDIKYIFSDKTGTLTKNEMLLRGLAYDVVHLKHSESANFTSRYFSHDFNKNTILERLDSEVGNKKNLLEYTFINILVNSSVMLEDGEYRSPSPDEVALVNALREIEMELVSKTESEIIIKMRGELRKFSLLNNFEFTSERARSSAVIQRDGQIWLFAKGADNRIVTLLADRSRDETVKHHVEEYSRDGLRSLCYAYRIISATDYTEWERKFTEAKKKYVQDKSAKTLIDDLVAELENKLTFSGVTALEDKLQDEVADTVADLTDAGIKIWVLTGDKMSTAISIAKSCNLFEDSTKIVKVESGSEEEVKNRLLDIKSELDRLNNSPVSSFRQVSRLSVSSKEERGLIANGKDKELLEKLIETTLIADEDKRVMTELWNVMRNDDKIEQMTASYLGRAMNIEVDNSNIGLVLEEKAITAVLQEGNFEILKEIFDKCRSVICCRCSPLQKSAVVERIKQATSATCLAIGDGGNDVNMIKEANIGVGIFGKEGLQAAFNADYAFCQFKYLRPLVLRHGRLSLYRNSYFYYFFFFKNMIWTVPALYFLLFCGYSGYVII